MFTKFRKVLFCTDLAEHSRRAFQYAGGIAALSGASVTILHVIDKLPAGIEQRISLIEGEEAMRSLRERHEQEVRRSILIGKSRDQAEISRKVAEFYNWPPASEVHSPALEVDVREGDVASEILKATSEGAYDLVVMGAPSGLLGSTALGGITKTVLHKSRVPVVVVPPSQEP